jgi:hypothetical protein
MNKRRCNSAILGLLLAAATLPALVGTATADYPRGVSGGVEFVLKDDGAMQVHWAGDFNGWSTSANPFVQDDSGSWRLVLPLPPGEYEYKFVVDGNYIADPDNPQTRGEYGNTWLKVKSDGSVEEAGGGRAPSALNSKLFIGGLYYGNYQLEAAEREGKRVLLEKPVHDINLGLELALSPSLRGEVELNVNNRAELSEMWRTQFNFQRARLILQRPQFRLELFDNVGTFVSDDPLQLAGNVGSYRLDYGYGARGAIFEKTLPYDLSIRALLADSGEDNPWRPQDLTGLADFSDVPYAQYYRSMTDGYRDDLVLQASRSFDTVHLLYLAKAARGLRPGVLFHQTVNSADSSLTQVNYRTVQDNLLQAAVWGQDWTDWLRTDVELVWGGARLQAKDRAYVMLDGDTSYTETFRDERGWDLQKTRGGTVHMRIAEGRALNLELRHRYQENRNLFEHMSEPLTNYTSREVNSWARSYAADLNFERGDWRYRLTVEQEEFEFDQAMSWADHFWFADGLMGAGNLWINGNQLPLAKYGLLGYRSASVISQRLEIPMTRADGKGGDLNLSLAGSIASTRLDRAPLYWDLESEWRWRPNPRWELLYNQRFAVYDHDFLDLNTFFVDQFAELSYHVGRSAVISLGWGVDPYWLNPDTKTFMPHGRREFLAEQGVDEATLQTNYLRLGSILGRAEEALSEIQRVSLEARVNF